VLNGENPKSLPNLRKERKLVELDFDPPNPLEVGGYKKGIPVFIRCLEFLDILCTRSALSFFDFVFY
jgi:hypothetical protein